MHGERHRIGSGFEHEVFLPKSSEEYVLKIPNQFTSVLIRLPGSNRVQALRNEIEAAHDSVKDTSIVIPETRIFSFGSSYIMTQEYITEDDSVDKDAFFEQVPETFRLNYDLHPNNFISSNGTIYWIDPSRGFITRTLENAGIIQKEAYWKLKLRIKNALGNVFNRR